MNKQDRFIATFIIKDAEGNENIIHQTEVIGNHSPYRRQKIAKKQFFEDKSIILKMNKLK